GEAGPREGLRLTPGRPPGRGRPLPARHRRQVGVARLPPPPGPPAGPHAVRPALHHVLDLPRGSGRPGAPGGGTGCDRLDGREDPRRVRARPSAARPVRPVSSRGSLGRPWTLVEDP